jgi:predicted PolB exonuclease-like 3'-5' exonuclease
MEKNMIANLYLDLETVPAQRPDVLEEIRAAETAARDAALDAVKAPSNYGREAAEKWMVEKGQAQRDAIYAAFDTNVDAAYRKTGLDGTFGQICVIGWALNDEPVRTLWNHEWADSERELLESFYYSLTDAIPANMERTTCVIGHNVVGFDLRYLTQRSIVNNVRPHRVIAAAAQAKPWELERVYDTMVQWGGTGAKPGGSLDKLCRALSVPTPKGDITGATVWDAVQAGRIAEVAAYCARDVEAVRAVHRRMTFSSVVVEQFDDVPA